MIRFRDVSKLFSLSATGKPVRALDGVTLEIDAGQFVAIRGPSGCGKSTLLSLAGTLALPSSGTVEVDGRSTSGMSAGERARLRAAKIGFVFQMFHLLPYLNVRANVLLGAAGNGSTSADSRAAELLDRFGLAERLDHRPGQLSAGERQRVAMARAMMNGPELILADEPTGNLDPESAAIVLDLLAQFHRDGGTVLLVTHDPVAAQRAHRVVSLRDGRVESDAAAKPA